MASRLAVALSFVVRATGLFGVIGIAAALIGSAFFSGQLTAFVAIGCSWVIAAAVLSWPRVPDAWRSDPPTEKQIKYAQALGIVVPAGISKGMLSDLITAAKAE